MKINLQRGTTLHQSEWPSKNLQTINAREGMDKSEPSYTVGGNVNWYSHYEEQYRASLKKLKIELPYDPMAESEEELKPLLMKVKEESENVDLKLHI